VLQQPERLQYTAETNIVVDQIHFTSVRFHRFKSFREYSVQLREFNVMVGANNSGKSTIISAFKILAEGIKKARARKAEYIRVPGHGDHGYRIDLSGLPISTENVFTDYDDSEPASVTFRLSNKNTLQLVFPDINQCILFCETTGIEVRTPAQFKKEYPVSVGFVPVLGPVEHNEPLYKVETARIALMTHTASRNFRNIWWHYPDDFGEFRELIRSTWPGMDIQPPEAEYGEKNLLHMFCPEERYPREIYWAGFGFQVWCQMLTFMVRSRGDTIFIIDEPDIYLHSDLQRQLVGLLKTLGPNILIATHSTEIISEAEPFDLLIVNKKFNSAKRIKDPSEIQDIFSVLGSNLNPTLSQLAKTRRVVFVEGKDFQLIGSFARKLGKEQVASRSEFAVIPVEGFHPQKVRDFSHGMEITLGTTILKCAIFDRDYRSPKELDAARKELSKVCDLAYIHNRKEIENYLLEPGPLGRAIRRRIEDRKRRGQIARAFDQDIRALLMDLSEPLKTEIQGQYLAKRATCEKQDYPHHDLATINATLLSEFEKIWSDFQSRMQVVPGKRIHSMLNRQLQAEYSISLSAQAIIACFEKRDIPAEIENLIDGLDDFRQESPPSER
jgi:energy-coupling factor transporter ATP-binding protein EcfA2